MAGQVPNWMRELRDRLWDGSEAFTEERHGLTVLTCFPQGVSGRVIVVREEYLQLWDYIKDAFEGKLRGGLVLTGQPGIGKTFFLRYALARAMHEKIPVAYCHSPDEYFFYDGNGCARYSLTAPKILHDVGKGKFFLALVDSSGLLATLPPTFLDEFQMCYTVQATTLDPARWHGLAKERGARFWIMSFWTEDEVRKLQRCYEQDGPHPWTDSDAYYSPLDVFRILGPSARGCFLEGGYRKTPRGPAVDFRPGINPDALLDDVDVVVAALGRGRTDTGPPQHFDFHRLIFASKPHGFANPIRAPALCYNVPTLHLRRLLLARFRERTEDQQAALIARLARFPEVMSFVYEPMILDVLTSPKAPVICHLADGSAFALGPGLTLISDEVGADSNTPIVPRDDHIYFLRNFPWLSAFVTSEDQTRVTLLHTTVAPRRKVVSSAVSAVIQLVRRSMPNTASAVTKWSLIFVSPGASGMSMAKKLQTVKFRHRQHPTVAAGWLEIGARLSYSRKVLDALEDRDALVDLDEVVDDEAEPGMDEDPSA